MIELYKIYYLSDFSRKEKKNNLTMLGTLGTIGALGTVGALAATGKIKVKSFIRKGRVVKSYERKGKEVLEKSSNVIKNIRSEFVDNWLRKQFPEAKESFIEEFAKHPVGGELAKKAKKYNITPEEQIGIHEYMGGGYKKINGYLRAKSIDKNIYNEELEKLSNFAIEGMKKLQKINTNEIKELDRYIKLDQNKINSYQIGEEYITPQITSTTGTKTGQRKIMEAALVANDANTKIVYTPKINSSAINLGEVHEIERREHVYLPGTKFKVTDKKEEFETIGGKEKKITVIYMDEL